MRIGGLMLLMVMVAGAVVGMYAIAANLNTSPPIDSAGNTVMQAAFVIDDFLNHPSRSRTTNDDNNIGFGSITVPEITKSCQKVGLPVCYPWDFINKNNFPFLRTL